MLAQEIIARKRDGHALSRDEIDAFVGGVVSGDFKDYQASSLLMAILLNGMSGEETMHLTEAMTRSGRVVDLSEIDRPRLDKHSTGGVGDKVSLVLAPLAASCGLCVPMMSGRGLGHTGGTLDKLEAIPGFQVDLPEAAYRDQLQWLHVAMISQSAAIAPADRKLYALRDVTATVESIPLICASILSKKMAEGIDGLVLDVKFGRGAFMATLEEARELAEALVQISRRMGKSTSALITRMDVPLGRAVGNGLEVREALECLRGSGPADLMEVTYALTAEMLRLGRVVESASEAQDLMERQIESGAALAVFREMVVAQGGDASVIDHPEELARAGRCLSIRYEGSRPAFLADLDARIVGEAARVLGAGRTHAEAPVDPAVGFVFQKKPGDELAPNDPLVEVHSNDEEKLKEATTRLRAAFQYSPDPFTPPGLVVDRI
ncbi:MAG: thymidine phosphorylase [Opitutales bacterium]